MAGPFAGGAGVLDDGVCDSSSGGVGDHDCLGACTGHVPGSEGDDDGGVGIVVTAATGDTVLVVERSPAVAETGDGWFNG